MDPEWRDLWRDAYPSVLPAYHMNKEHWSSVILDGSVPNGELRKMAAGSYELVAGIKKSRKFSRFLPRMCTGRCGTFRREGWLPTARLPLWRDIRELPGRWEALCGTAQGSWNVPATRVISGSGKLAPAGTFGKPGTQERLLEAEGIPVKNHKVDLEKWRM